MLIGCKVNNQILNWNGKIIAKKSLDNKNYPSVDGKYFSRYLIEKGDAKPIEGFQLKYIYLIDKTCKITVPILPFSKIDEMGAGMYKGKKISIKDRRVEHENNALSVQGREGGAVPTCALHFNEIESISK